MAGDGGVTGSDGMSDEEVSEMQYERMRSESRRRTSRSESALGYTALSVLLHLLMWRLIFYWEVPEGTSFLVWCTTSLMGASALLSNACAAVAWVFYMKTSYADPGYVPRHTLPPNMEELPVIPGWRVCGTCQAVKPIRSKHCRVCNRCVHHFDHHCPFVNNCVGRDNAHLFWLLLFFHVIDCVINSWHAIHVYRAGAYADAELWYLYAETWALIMTGLACWWTFAASGLLLTLSYHALFNITMNERVNHARFPYVHLGSWSTYRNVFDAGPRSNCALFWGWGGRTRAVEPVYPPPIYDLTVLQDRTGPHGSVGLDDSGNPGLDEGDGEGGRVGNAPLGATRGSFGTIDV